MLNNKNKRETENVQERERERDSRFLLQAVCRLCNIFFTFQHTFTTPRTSLTRRVRVKVPTRRHTLE